MSLTANTVLDQQARKIERLQAQATELALRLADAAEWLREIPTDEDGEPKSPVDGGHLSALDHILIGSSGCIDPEEHQLAREAALERHRDRLDLDGGLIREAMSKVVA